MNYRLINKYYKRLLHNCRESYKKDILKKNDFIVESYINHFVNLNYQHLLTDSILTYITTGLDMMKSLYDFCPIVENDTRTFKFLCFYYNRIICDFKKDTKKQEKYISLQDDVTLYATNLSREYLELISKHKEFNLKDVSILKKIIIGTLSYCSLNNKLSEFESIIKPLMNDPYQMLDRTKLNGFTPYYDPNERLLDYIINLIENTSNIILIK